MAKKRVKTVRCTSCGIAVKQGPKANRYVQCHKCGATNFNY